MPNELQPSPKDPYQLPRRLFLITLLIVSLCPYALLILQSLGSGWSFPQILPNRIDFAPWKNFAADRDGLFAAAGNSLLMSLLVSIPSTFCGLLTGKALYRSMNRGWLFVAYLPFVLSPVVIGTCLHSLMIRAGLSGTLTGVVATQGIFAFAFATVFFCEMWSPDILRAEALVATLGGGPRAVWRHAILPKAGGLILVCLLQTALFSWLDYGLVSVIGGGNVHSLTLKLFSYIREASVNQAAQSGIVLLLPPLCVILLTAVLLGRRFRPRLTAGSADVHN